MSPGVQVAREKTALSRKDLSRPIRLALDDGLIADSSTILDYGCGRGDDVDRLRGTGYNASGWDPHHHPTEPLNEADVVNLGYVINVIEHPLERRDTLLRAWQLASQVLVVAARLHLEARDLRGTPYSDGVVTSSGTFQKFYDQHELREWIESSLEQTPIAAGPGIFYVFRSDLERATFLARRRQRSFAAPSLRRSDVLFAEHEALLGKVMDFFVARGRLPEERELVAFADLEKALGSIKRAFGVIQRVTGSKRWREIQRTRADELLINLALSKFQGRPKMGQLPRSMQLDIRAFFSAYKQACGAADNLLFSLGDDTSLAAAFEEARVGNKTLRALFVHADCIDQLPPTLRVYEGCAREYIGSVEGANVIKLHRLKPAVTYMAYEDFERTPHPALVTSLRVELHTFNIKFTDFSTWSDPPVLLRKDKLVPRDHLLHTRFRRLALQEQRLGLFDAEIDATRMNVERFVTQRGMLWSGHRLTKA